MVSYNDLIMAREHRNDLLREREHVGHLRRDVAPAAWAQTRSRYILAALGAALIQAVRALRARSAAPRRAAVAYVD